MRFQYENVRIRKKKSPLKCRHRRRQLTNQTNRFIALFTPTMYLHGNSDVFLTGPPEERLLIFLVLSVA